MAGSEAMNKLQDIQDASAKFDEYFKPDRIVIVGVWDEASKRTNLITIGFITYMGVGDDQVIVFPVHPNRHSHRLFKAEPYFIVNLLNAEQYEIAHTCGTISGRKGDKYKLAGITPFKIPDMDINVEAIKEAPYFMLAEKMEVKGLKGCTHDIVVGKSLRCYETGNKPTKPLWHVSESEYYEFLKPYGGAGYGGGYGSCR